MALDHAISGTSNRPSQYSQKAKRVQEKQKLPSTFSAFVNASGVVEDREGRLQSLIRKCDELNLFKREVGKADTGAGKEQIKPGEGFMKAIPGNTPISPKIEQPAVPTKKELPTTPKLRTGNSLTPSQGTKVNTNV